MQPPIRSPGRNLSDPNPIGIAADATQPLLQSDAYKELANKLAWAIGSTYRVPYANVRTAARRAALRLAQDLVAAQGYPIHIGYPK